MLGQRFEIPHLSLGHSLRACLKNKLLRWISRFGKIFSTRPLKNRRQCRHFRGFFNGLIDKILPDIGISADDLFFKHALRHTLRFSAT